MIIEWEQRISVHTDAPFALVAECCQAVEGVAQPLGVHLVITDDEDIHQINREYRGIDRATDVLSFPSVNYPKGKTSGALHRRFFCVYQPGGQVISRPPSTWKCRWNTL